MTTHGDEIFVFPDALHRRLERDLLLFQESYRKTTTTNFGFQSFPTLAPALPPGAELWLTICYISLYGILFLIIYLQLWMIWYYRHKRLSHQTVFLFLCLLWTGLRTTLFSFYFKDCLLANKLPIGLSWLLYSFPVCLQYVTLCLLVLFFAQVVFKARARYEPSRYKQPLRIGVCLSVVIFLATNISSAILVKNQAQTKHSVPIEYLIIRVSINDTLFLIAAILLSFCIYKMSKMSASSVVLEAKGTTLCQALATSIITILLFTSRVVYNFLVICPHVQDKLPSFGYGWVNVSDQADIHELDKGYAYVSFGIVLFVWEFLPTFIIVIFFRVRKPPTSTIQSISDASTFSQGSRAYFFDNPRRYDSDDDLSRNDLLRGSYEYSYAQSINSETRHTPRQTPRATPKGTPYGTPRMYGGINASSGNTPNTHYGSYQNYN